MLTSLTLSVAGILADDASTPEEWEAFGRLPGIVLVRWPTGRRVYGFLNKVATGRKTDLFANMSYDFTEADYTE